VCTANYEKKRRKVGRPPGGHSNLEQLAATRRRGGRRKRHRRIVLTLRKKHSVGPPASAPADEDVADYEIDSRSTASGSEQPAGVAPADGGERRPPAVGAKPPSAAVSHPVRRKRRFDALPARDMQTRAAKMQRYRFEKRTHQKVLRVSPYETDTATPCDVSPCQVTSAYRLTVSAIGVVLETSVLVSRHLERLIFQSLVLVFCCFLVKISVSK